ncbi:MAG: MASE1 domain-containing protein [Fibrobacterales bacterium]
MDNSENKFGASYFISMLSLTIIYAIIEALSERLVFEGISSSLVWPPVGFAFAMILLLGYRYLPVIFIGAILTKMSGGGDSAFLDAFSLVNIVVAAGKVVEVYVGAYLFRRYIDTENRLLTSLGVLRFIMVAAAMAVVGAGIGATALCVSGVVAWDLYFAVIKTWWIGDFVGVLLVTLMFLGWSGPSVIPDIKDRRIELFSLGTMIVFGGTVVFGLLFDGVTFPVYILIPLLLWAAIRFGRRVTAISSFLVSSIAIWATLNGFGELVDEKHVYVTMSNLQAFIAILSLMVYVLATAFSERTVAEKETVKLKYYLSNIINSMPSILIGVDADLTVTQWNTTAAINTGISEDNANGRLLTKLDSRFKGISKKVLESIETGELIRDVSERMSESGAELYENITIYPLYEKTSVGAVIRIDDVTKETEMQKELSHGRKMDAIGQLVGGVAHDFNNMLAGILGGAQLLKSPSVNLNEKGEKYVDLIVQSADRASDLTNKLLSFGHKGKFVSTTVDVHTILDDTVDMLSRTINKNITVSIEKNMNNAGIIGDDSALGNAFLNIGINASQAMPDGGSITFETHQVTLEHAFCEKSSFDIVPGEFIEILIHDTGCGIPLKSLSKIFEPFYTTKKQGEGTGLGLAAVHGMVVDHKGVINVTSIEGKGATFSIYLPLCDTHVVEENVDKPAIKGKGTVLLVDDEEILQLTMSHMLKDLGYSVISAYNGAEAVKLYEEHCNTVDIILLDMIMPVMNGRDAFPKLKEIKSDCKVIVTTGFSPDGSMTDLKKSGVCAFLRKPFKLHELSETMNKYLKE